MGSYQKVLIADTTLFAAGDFPQLGVGLLEIVKMMKPSTSVREQMLLSYVKDHSMNSQAVRDNVAFEELILSRALPIDSMETLFESSRSNIPFRKGPEDYIKAFLQNERS